MPSGPKMPGSALVEPQGNGCRISVTVSTGASNRILRDVADRRLLGPDILGRLRGGGGGAGGEANEELIRFLVDRLSVRMSDVKIVKGALSSHKSIYLPLKSSEALRLLGGI